MEAASIAVPDDVDGYRCGGFFTGDAEHRLPRLDSGKPDRGNFSGGTWPASLSGSKGTSAHLTGGVAPGDRREPARDRIHQRRCPGRDRPATDCWLLLVALALQIGVNYFSDYA